MTPLLLGIEIGGTKLQLGMGRGDGEIVALERRLIQPERGAAGILEQIESAFDTLKQRQATDIAAVGIGFGGPVDPSRGLTVTSHQVAGWDRFPLADWVRQTLKVQDVEIQNDADTAGLAEAHFGAGQGFSPLLYVTIGSGIGGGLICDGSIYRGAGAGAVEIGHLWVRDRYDAKGNMVALEEVSSGWAIARQARRLGHAFLADGQNWVVNARVGNDPQKITTQDIAEAAQAGDEACCDLLELASDAFAEGLRQAVTLLAPRRIVLGGGVSLIGERLWLGPVRKKLDRDVFPPFRGTFDVVPAQLDEDVVIHGALAIACACSKARETPPSSEW